VMTIDTINTIRRRRTLQLLAVKLGSAIPETLCSLLGSDVALRFGEHFVADLELTDGSAPEQRWEEVDMEMTALDLFRRASQGRLMYTHA
jgi:membrane-bound lytic murein transglycosylase MltF